MVAKATRKRKAPRPKSAPRARVTKPDKETGQTGAGWEEARYEAWLWSIGGHVKEEIYVNHYTALTYSVVWACVRYISQTIASLGWHVFQSVSGKPGKERIYPTEDDVAWLLDTQSSPEMDAFNWRQVMLKDALTWGNGYSEIDRDAFGRPRWLYYIAPDRVSLKRYDTGQLYYEIDNGPGNKPTELPPERMFHLRGVGPDGLIGYSVIGLARATIKLGLQEEKYGETFFRRGPMPGGLLELPGNPKKEEREAARKTFEQTYGGADKAGRVVVVSGGVKFNPLSLPNDDAQFVESRKFGVNEVCRWFGVPPHKVFDLERATFSNIEHQSIEAVQDCHLPWCRRLETEADLKLYGRIMRGRRWTRLNLNTLLRGDSKTQTENLVSQVTSGITMLDEAREHLDMNPLPDGMGETPLVQGAMKTLDDAINPPEPPAPAPMPGEPAQDDDEEPQEEEESVAARAMPAQVAVTFGQLLSDCYSRLIRVESDKAHRANNKGELNQYVRDFYNDERRRTAVESLRPVLAALFLACGQSADNAEIFAEIFAAEHADRSIRELNSGEWVQSWTNGRADEQAQAHLREIWERIRS